MANNPYTSPTQGQSKPSTRGATMMLRGVGLAVAGVVITWIFYTLTPDGGYYPVFTSLVVIGAIYFIVGLLKMLVGK